MFPVKSFSILVVVELRHNAGPRRERERGGGLINKQYAKNKLVCCDYRIGALDLYCCILC